jgi:hypothetical protein
MNEEKDKESLSSGGMMGQQQYEVPGQVNSCMLNL